MNDARRILVVYDRQCPMCDFYCQLVRIRESAGSLELVNAREDSDIMRRITEAGLDIDEGIVLVVEDELYYGPEAIHRLALLGTRSGIFNRVAYWAFRSRRVSGILYPVLKACRNLLLKILGRTRINNLRLPGNERF
jgi:predicted DCC family thiol-disulfide oxidoreductase YuxK